MMTPKRPYLLRAIYEWIVDNDLTPYVLVDATIEGVFVPNEYVKEGQIVLSMSPTAVKDLSMENDWIFFSARFAGKKFDITIPISAVLAVYAKENNQGMVFPPEDIEMASLKDLQDEIMQGVSSEEKVTEEPVKKTAKKKPHLSIVK